MPLVVLLLVINSVTFAQTSAVQVRHVGPSLRDGHHDVRRGFASLGETRLRESHGFKLVGIDPPPADSPFDDLLEGISADRKETDQAPQSQVASPLADAHRAMLRAQQQLQTSAGTKAAAETQQTAIDALDALLQQIQKSSQPPQVSQSQPNTTEPAPADNEDQPSKPPQEESPGESSSVAGSSDPPSEDQLMGQANTDPAAFEKALRESIWGHLPDRVRQELQASMPDEFHPRYKQAIAEYFRQLSKSQ